MRAGFAGGVLLGALALSSNAVALGVPNVPQTPGELLSGPNAPEAGRTPVIAYHGGMLLTFPEAPGSPPGDWLVRAWDIADPTNPLVTQTIGPTQHGFMAHGFIKHNNLLNSGYTLEVDGSGNVSQTGGINFRMLGWTHGGMSVPWGATNYWSYGDTSQLAELYLDQNYGATPLAVFDPVGATGVIGHPFIFGRYLFYASDQSRSGITSYDISDPTNPVLLDVLTDGSVGGYWPDPVGVNGRLYFFFPHDNPDGGFHVVDASDPSDLKLVADVPLEGNLNYAQFQDEFAFSERYKIDMRTFEVVLELDEDADHRSGDPIDTSQFSLPIGNLVITGGNFKGGTCNVPGFSSNHCGTGMSIWAHQAEPDSRGPFVAYHAPADGETNYPTDFPLQLLIHETLDAATINASNIILRPLVNGQPGIPVSADYWFASNDILSIVPDTALAADTTYRLELVAGGIRDAVGNGMQAYTFEFSTGSNVNGNARPVIDTLAATPRPVEPGSSLSINVSATDADHTTLEYRFDFGDGSPLTTWGSADTASHTYAEPGHYTVTAQVRDPLASIATATTGVTVITPVLDVSGSSNNQIALQHTSEGDFLWVVNPDNNTVSVVAADSNELVAEHRVCADPRSIAIDAGERIWISCFDADRVLLLSPQGEHLTQIDFDYGAAPFAISMNSSASLALVSLYGNGELVLVDTTSQSILDTLPLGPTPRAVAWSADGSRALVTRFISPPMHGEVWDVAVSANSLALNGVITLDHQWGEDLRFDGRGVPNYLAAIRITRDGTRAWVAAKKDNITRGLYASGSDLDQDNTVRAITAVIDLNSASEIRSLRLDIDNAAEPGAISFSPLGDYAFVALQGSNAVVVIDSLKLDNGFAGVSSVISRIGVGRAPQALYYENRGGEDQLRVHDFMGRSLTSIDLMSLLGSGAASFSTTTTHLVTHETLPAAVLAGKRVFYNAADPRMSGEGYLSCATCHIDGGHDGRTYDFSGRGEGLRNTTSLNGRGGLAHGLVHWSANFDEIQDFEHDIRGPFGGQGFLTNADFAVTSDPLGSPKAGLSTELDQLASYLASLDLQSVPRSPHRAANGDLSAAGLRGAGVFNALGCDSCHSGVMLTANTSNSLNLVDVGTLGSRSGERLGTNLAGIDIPSLHGLWQDPPYLHHGEAETLEAMLLHTGASVWQAEDMLAGGGYEIRNADHWSLQQQAAVRAGAFVTLWADGNLTFEANMPQAQSATLTLRYHANYQDTTLALDVNGNVSNIIAPLTLANDWRFVNWGEVSIPISLNAGANSINLRYLSGSSFALDEVSLNNTAAALAAANPHHVANQLSAADKNDLLAYLLELDGRPHARPAAMILSPSPGALIAADGLIQGSSNGDTVLIAINDGTFEAAIGNSTWQYQIPTGALSDGIHTLTVRVVDAATGTYSEVQQQFEVNNNQISPTQVPMVAPLALLLLALTLALVNRRQVIFALHHTREN